MEQRTFCRICQAYCGLVVDVSDGAVVRVRADKQHPVSRGYSCTKGRALGELHTDPRRLLVPRLLGRDATWDEVLDDLAGRVRGVVDEHGPDAVAVFRGTAAYFDSAALVALGALVAGLGTEVALHHLDDRPGGAVLGRRAAVRSVQRAAAGRPRTARGSRSSSGPTRRCPMVTWTRGPTR